MPFYAGTLDLPRSIQHADILKFDRNSMWMAFNYVANYSMLKYSYMIKDIRAERDRFESSAFGKQQGLEANALALWNKGDRKGAREMLTRYSDQNAKAVLDEWWKLSKNLYLKYNDGYVNTSAAIAHPVFYAAWWLKQVGYENGPTGYQKKTAGN